MYGAILGDIIGSRFELDRGKRTKKFKLFTEQNYFTDDTVMTIAVGEALLNLDPAANLKETIEAITASMKKWGNKYPYAGYGERFKRWLMEDDPKPYNSYGNGSAMRVSAAGWLYSSLEMTRAMARITAEVTHTHYEGIKGADCTATVIYLSRTGSSKKEIQEFVNNEFKYDVSETLEEMREDYEHDESCQDTLPKALRSFYDGNSYEDVIRNAISLGGDTDTIAAIAGSMAEAYYGIPEHLIAEGKLYLSKDIQDVLDGFNKVLEAPTYSKYRKPNIKGGRILRFLRLIHSICVVP